MGLVDRVLARTLPAGERREEYGSSAIPGPGEGPASSFATAPQDLRQPDRARQKTAIWAATDLIASLCATLPLDTYQAGDGVGGQARQVPNSKLIEDPGGDGNGTEDWIYQYLMSKLIAGNAVGRPTSRDPRTGQPTQIVLYHPEDVQGWRDRQTGKPRWRVEGREVDADEIWHRRAYPMPGCLLGMSPIGYQMTVIGEGVAASRFGLQFFTDGAHPSSLLTNSEVAIDPKVAAQVKARYLAVIHGTREPLVLGKGWEHKPLSVNPDESQFLETQKFTAAECARIYGPGLAEILGYETGGSMTYANVESRSVHLLTYTLDRWLVDVERMFSRMLPQPQFVRYNRAALLRTTTLERYRAHALALSHRWKVVNEVRGDEDMPRVPWGDEPNEPSAGKPAFDDDGREGK